MIKICQQSLKVKYLRFGSPLSGVLNPVFSRMVNLKVSSEVRDPFIAFAAFRSIFTYNRADVSQIVS